MKFYMVVNYYLVYFNLKFHEDPCINARARFIASACVYNSFARIKCKYLRNESSDLYKILYGGRLLFHEDLN